MWVHLTARVASCFCVCAVQHVWYDWGLLLGQVALHLPASNYPWNSIWGTYGSLVEIAQAPYFQQLFALPFSTFVLVSYSVTGLDDNYWNKGVCWN